MKIGDAYVFQNKYDKGLEAYETAIRTYPAAAAATAQAYYKKGLALRHVGQADDAREAFEACIAQRSEWPAAGRIRASCAGRRWEEKKTEIESSSNGQRQ